MQMRRGHKRTHSANLACNNWDQNSFSGEYSPIKNHSQVVHLLKKSELKAKQKTFQIDLLNLPTPSDQSLLFNFGKGTAKAILSQRGKNDEQLNVIPEKRRHHLGKTRKHSQMDVLCRKKDQSTQHSILKISNKQVSKIRVFNESVNKIFKEKLKDPVKTHAKKVSLFQEKPKIISKPAAKQKKSVTSAK